LRALPKHIRKSFVPVPEHAVKACEEIEKSGDFFAALAHWITRASGDAVSAEELAALPLPEHLRFNIRIVDLQGKVVTQTRDIGKANVAVTTKQAQTRAAPAASQANVYRAWDFGDLPESREVERGRLHYIVYPALEDRGDAVGIVDARTSAEAEAISREGVLRLTVLTLPQLHKFARKTFADNRELVLLAQGLTLAQPLPDALAHRAFRACFVEEEQPPPRARADFDALLDRHRDRFGDVVEKVLALALDLLRELRNVRQRMNSITSPTLVTALLDVKTQLEQLLPNDFITRMPQSAFANVPRYLKAMGRRLERLPTSAKRDAELMQQLKPATAAWRELKNKAGSRITPELDTLRWMLEEFRVSLYAQDLKTAIPVSAKRLELQLEKAKAEVAKP
jgi:ATP-dependent helicase HrpA